MARFRFGILTVLQILCGLFTTIDYGHTASVKNKDETFNINITMPKFNTTQVRLERKDVHFEDLFF